MNTRVTALALGAAFAGAACGASPAPLTRFPSGHPVLLLEAPVHLGDNRAGGQSFVTGEAYAARICSLVTLPEPTLAYLQVQNIRQTESLGDIVTVNDKPIRLPITLERDPYGITSNATSVTHTELVSLSAGPSEICIVAGLRPCGDLDDFEIDQLALFVQGVDVEHIAVRRGLAQGRPPPAAPPTQPWGDRQQPYPASAYAPTSYCSKE